MTKPSPRPRPAGRKPIPAATEAALWALSNGRCYSPGCPQPVVVEIRPGVYRKNAQVAHIFGVKPNAARYVPPERLPEHVRDSFMNLLLLCYPHHGEVDDRKTGAELYPAATLLQWKTDHEGSDRDALAALGAIDEERLTELLLGAFTPPLERLEAITSRLEETHTVTDQTVRELRRIIRVMAASEISIDARAVRSLAESAEIFNGRKFVVAADGLRQAADSLPKTLERLESTIYRLSRMEPGRW